jgi:hypothetical protein
MVTAQRVVVWSRPGNAAVIARLDRIDGNGYPTIFAILGAVTRGCTLIWFRVQLSLPPNGHSGWVRPWGLTSLVVHSKIVVQLPRRRLVAYRCGKRSSRPESSDASTPVGRFFVDGRFVLSDSNGPFGAAMLSVSADSNAWMAQGETDRAPRHERSGIDRTSFPTAAFA